ncbi:tyrosine-protein phosphatase [Novosphingobium sp. PhB165]|uniref:tyrosine-protein phosphatase n=1 Tax=Novosphingobium sp. PhB165 TaxID=2485105 RepID=UPI001053DE37|nr:tyrosine-protein phosphatase [Novosphingobium sp. PhB165]
MTRAILLATLAAATSLAASPVLAATIDAPVVERLSPDTVAVRWNGGDPVDVLAAKGFDTPDSAASLLASKDAGGRFEAHPGQHERPIYLLRDTRTGQTVHVAERVLQLEQGTNFRDLGGYTGADGKHVRWGMLYRSGGQAMLTDDDVREIKGLGIVNLIDLRSNDERVLAPTRLDGIRYQAMGYSMNAINIGPDQLQKMKENPGVGLMAAYRTMPEMITPQIRMVFRTMLDHQGPLVWNCTAGQDRTGIVSALVLSALGVPRDQIYADYVLTTKSRNPHWEMPPISDATVKEHPAAAMWAAMQSEPAFAKPFPLTGADGVPFIAAAFQAIEAKWGSVDAFLDQGIGLHKEDIAQLRKLYLE